MKGYLDSSLYIIDNSETLYICAHGFNYGMRVTDQQKNEIYQLIEWLKVKNKKTDIQLSEFQNKLFEFFITKEIYLEQISEDKKDLLIREIESSFEFINVLYAELPKENKLIINENKKRGTYSLLNLDTNSEDSIRVDMDTTRIFISEAAEKNCGSSHKHISLNFLKYSAYVLLEILNKEQIPLNRLSEINISIDMTNYENQVFLHMKKEIDTYNFHESNLVNDFFSNQKLSFDLDVNFPLIQVKFKDEDNVYTSVGFNKTESINNLIYILKGIPEYKNKSLKYLGFKIDNSDQNISLLNKIIALYYPYQIDYLKKRRDKLQAICKNKLYTIDNYLPATLLISLCLNRDVSDIFHERERK